MLVVVGEERGLGRAYWRLFSAASLSSLADGTLKVALPLLALSYSTEPLAVASVGFALMLPWLLVSLPAGAIVDRTDRRRMLLLANLLRAGVLTVAVPAVLAGIGSIWLLDVVAFMAGVAETFYASAAQALVPRLLRRAGLDRGNAYQQIADQAANQFAGPAVGGLLAGVGVAVALGAPALVWVAAVVTLLGLRGSFGPRASGQQDDSLLSDIAAGVRFLARSLVLRSVGLCSAVTNLAGSAAAAVFVVYAVGPNSVLGLSGTGFGLLMTASALGSVAGALLVTRVRRVVGLRVLLGVNGVTQAAQIIIPVLTGNLVAVGAAYLLGGLGVALWNVATISLRQRVVPEHLLGRVISSHRLVGWGSAALGALAGGFGAQYAGLVPLFWTAGALSLLSLLALAPLAPARIAAEIG
jgi:MFS family permease